MEAVNFFEIKIRNDMQIFPTNQKFKIFRLSDETQGYQIFLLIICTDSMQGGCKKNFMVSFQKEG